MNHKKRYSAILNEHFIVCDNGSILFDSGARYSKESLNKLKELKLLVSAEKYSVICFDLHEMAKNLGVNILAVKKNEFASPICKKETKVTQTESVARSLWAPITDQVTDKIKDKNYRDKLLRDKKLF